MLGLYVTHAARQRVAPVREGQKLPAVQLTTAGTLDHSAPRGLKIWELPHLLLKELGCGSEPANFQSPDLRIRPLPQQAHLPQSRGCSAS